MLIQTRLGKNFENFENDMSYIIKLFVDLSTIIAKKIKIIIVYISFSVLFYNQANKFLKYSIETSTFDKKYKSFLFRLSIKIRIRKIL